VRKIAIGVVVSFLCPFLLSQQVLKNKTLIRLTEAGVADSAIVDLLNSNPVDFDISPNALNVLREAGADDKVIAVLIARTSNLAPSLAPRAESEAAMATVHFYRYKQSLGSGLNPSVYCDGTRLARIENGSYLDVSIPAGSHTFFAEDRQAGAVVKLDAGKEYYFRTDLQVGFWKGHFRLEMVQPEQGKYDLSKLKPLAGEQFRLRFTAMKGNL
jgi:hypothetical protein